MPLPLPYSTFSPPSLISQNCSSSSRTPHSLSVTFHFSTFLIMTHFCPLFMGFMKFWQSTGQREKKRGWWQILTDNANTICTQHRWCPKLRQRMKMTTVVWTQMSARLVEQLLFLWCSIFQDCKNPSAQVVMQVDVHKKKLNSQMQIVVGSQDSSC